MFRCYCLILFVFIINAVSANNIYENKAYSKNIRTIQVHLENEPLSEPIMQLNSNDRVVIEFDEMSHDTKDYSYRIFHCNGDWTQKEDLNVLEYLKGFEDNKLEESYKSINTTFLYSHYSLMIPNENVELLLSGNYVVEFFETDKPETILLTACFSISDEIVNIEGDVNGYTEYGINTRFQQLNLNIDYSTLPISDVERQLLTVVRQNGRVDSERKLRKATYNQSNTLIFKDNKQLIFEGAAEYSRIDFSHIRNYSGDIEKISFASPYYHVDVNPGKESNKYFHSIDVNGRYIIHSQSVLSKEENDYSIVHFTFPMEEPWLDGSLYVIGYFNNNNLDQNNKMVYNFDHKQYELPIVLKNGGYDYQYVFVPSGSNASTTRTCGSYWETENDYSVKVYYRANGTNYDQLVGVKTINSIQK